MTGKKFGKLTVIKYSGEKQKNVRMWECQCDCGNIVKVRTDSLTSGKVISCGCSKKSEEKIKHMIGARHIVDHTSDVFLKEHSRKIIALVSMVFACQKVIMSLILDTRVKHIT